MVRVMVIGNAGGGKSTMCRAVCAAHDLPYYAVDQIQWQPGWVQTPRAEFDAKHDAFLSNKRWLIDGYGPWHSVQARVLACDTIILIDHPIHIHYWWALKRQIKSLFVGRADGPQGCPMWPITFRLFRMMWWLHRQMRPKLLQAIHARAEHARIIHIKSPAQLERFVANPV